MLKKTITYEDYNGNTITEDFYFNLSKAEVIEMEASTTGGYGEMLKKIVEEKNIPLMMTTFKTFILKSVGLKSEDGKHFRKNPEIVADFESSEAYSVLFSELCTSAEAATAFIAGILPMDATQRKDLLEKAKNTELPASI